MTMSRDPLVPPATPMQASPTRTVAMPATTARGGRLPNMITLPTAPITVTMPGWIAAP
jgi:hypothetical protein